MRQEFHPKPPALVKGRYSARLATSADERLAVQRLRHLCFVEASGGQSRPDGLDRDDHDAHCRHAMIEDRRDGRLIATFRLMSLSSGAGIGRSYAAQFYDLTALTGYPGPMAELGRFCVIPGLRDPDVLRVAWGLLTRMVDEAGVTFLFGCASFAGADATPYRGALAMLHARHLAPPSWRPGVRAPEVVALAGPAPDPRLALLQVPPLLRTYLLMGGRVSDHAVIDRDLNTLHVFTGLETGRVPAARARALRAVAETCGNGVEPARVRG